MASAAASFYADVRRGDLAAIKRILGSNPNVLHSRTGLYQGTALHIAADLGHQAVIKLLLQHGADYASVDEAGEVPLMLAARQGHAAAVKELLADAGRRSCVRAMNKEGSTALHVAAAAGQAEVAQMLLDAGAKADVKDRMGRTPHDVAPPGRPGVSRVLQQGRHVPGGARSPPGAAAPSPRGAAPAAAAAAPRRSPYKSPRRAAAAPNPSSQSQSQSTPGGGSSAGLSLRGRAAAMAAAGASAGRPAAAVAAAGAAAHAAAPPASTMVVSDDDGIPPPVLSPSPTRRKPDPVPFPVLAPAAAVRGGTPGLPGRSPEASDEAVKAADEEVMRRTQRLPLRQLALQRVPPQQQLPEQQVPLKQPIKPPPPPALAQQAPAAGPAARGAKQPPQSPVQMLRPPSKQQQRQSTAAAARYSPALQQQQQQQLPGATSAASAEAAGAGGAPQVFTPRTALQCDPQGDDLRPLHRSLAGRGAPPAPAALAHPQQQQQQSQQQHGPLHQHQQHQHRAQDDQARWQGVAGALQGLNRRVDDHQDLLSRLEGAVATTAEQLHHTAGRLQRHEDETRQELREQGAAVEALAEAVGTMLQQQHQQQVMEDDAGPSTSSRPAADDATAAAAAATAAAAAAATATVAAPAQGAPAERPPSAAAGAAGVPPLEPFAVEAFMEEVSSCLLLHERRIDELQEHGASGTAIARHKAQIADLRRQVTTLESMMTVMVTGGRTPGGGAPAPPAHMLMAAPLRPGPLSSLPHLQQQLAAITSEVERLRAATASEIAKIRSEAEAERAEREEERQRLTAAAEGAARREEEARREMGQREERLLHLREAALMADSALQQQVLDLERTVESRMRELESAQEGTAAGLRAVQEQLDQIKSGAVQLPGPTRPHFVPPLNLSRTASQSSARPAGQSRSSSPDRAASASARRAREAAAAVKTVSSVRQRVAALESGHGLPPLTSADGEEEGAGAAGTMPPPQRERGGGGSRNGSGGEGSGGSSDHEARPLSVAASGSRGGSRASGPRASGGAEEGDADRDDTARRGGAEEGEGGDARRAPAAVPVGAGVGPERSRDDVAGGGRADKAPRGAKADKVPRGGAKEEKEAGSEGGEGSDDVGAPDTGAAAGRGRVIRGALAAAARRKGAAGKLPAGAQAVAGGDGAAGGEGRPPGCATCAIM